MTAQDGFPPILLRQRVVGQPGEGHEPGDRLLGNLLLKQRLRLRLGPDLHRVLIRDHLPAHERLRQPEHRVDHHLVPLARDRMAGVGDSGRSRREKGLKHHRHGRNDAPPSQSLMIGKGRRGPERGPAFDDGGRNRLLQHPQDCSVDAGKRGLLLVFVRGRRTDRPERRRAEAQGGQFEVESLLERAWQGERSNPAPPLVQQGAARVLRGAMNLRPLPGGVEVGGPECRVVGGDRDAQAGWDGEPVAEQPAQSGRLAADERRIIAAFQ